MLNNNIHPRQIGFDFDGVIADIGEAFLRIACEQYDYCSIGLEDLTSFHVETCTPIPDSIVDSIFGDILVDSLATGLQPIPGALGVIEDMTEIGAVTIITARKLHTPVADWFMNYLSSEVCSKINIIAMSDHDQKVQYIEQHNLTHFIDDRPETCVQVADAGLSPILFRQPWNSSWKSFATVQNWDQIANLFSE